MQNETDGSMKFITGEDLRTLVSMTKSKERYVEVEFDEALQEAFYKVRTGEIFDELESRRISTRRFTEMQATELVIKTKFIDNSRQMYQRGSF